MKMITPHIVDLLYSSECVIVPGLGGFIKAYSPAKVDHTTNELLPPSGNIAFNAGLCGNDGLLANHIANRLGISYTEAIGRIKHWVEKSFARLENGEKLVLENIGEIELGPSGTLEFTPARQINFNSESYGLPILFANPITPIVVEEAPLPSRRFFKNVKLITVIPESLKWAAVLAPFAAFTIWGSMNGKVIDNYVHSYTGMTSWMRATHAVSPTEKKAIIQPKVKVAVTSDSQTSTNPPINQNTNLEPAVISYGELAKNNIAISKASDFPVKEIATKTVEFHIISGAFRDNENVKKHIQALKDLGYNGAVLDTTPAGLIMVSMKKFDSYQDAAAQLNIIKKAGYSSYWIYKKKRG